VHLTVTVIYRHLWLSWDKNSSSATEQPFETVDAGSG